MIFDTHSHYDDEEYENDRDELLRSLKDNSVEMVVNVGASMETSKSALLLSKKYDFVYAALGVHPSEVCELTEADLEWILNNSREKKVVAIGEIGLDYHYKEPEKPVQKKWFIRQIELAREAKLPIIIHSRDAASDTLEIVKNEKAYELGGVIHCFSYSKEMAMEYVEMGFYIGIGGVLTFKNAKKLKEAAKEIPLESIVLETDCPYLAPEPYRGTRNNSILIKYVAEELANIKGVSTEEIIDITTKNAKKLYRIAE